MPFATGGIPTYTAPTIADGMVDLGTHDGQVYALALP